MSLENINRLFLIKEIQIYIFILVPMHLRRVGYQCPCELHVTTGLNDGRRPSSHVSVALVSAGYCPLSVEFLS